MSEPDNRFAVIAMLLLSLILLTVRLDRFGHSFLSTLPAAPSPAPAPLDDETRHPTMPDIRVNIPSWAYNPQFDKPESFTDPITNLTGPLDPPPLPHETVLGWPIAKAQGIEDIYAIDSFFYRLGRPGYVVESGALDGLQFSVSWWLSFVLGWRAVHVEAGPTNFKALKKWRTESLDINAVLCRENPGGHLHYAQKSPSVPMPIDGIWEFMPLDYKKTWWAEALTNESLVESFASVYCSPLHTLLAPFEVPFVDLWVLDVEGGELSVLQSHDFDALPVNVLCVEADEFNPSKNKAVREFLAERGYIFHSTFPFSGNPINDWFFHESFSPSHAEGF